jgi:hypothetical protein
MEPLPVDVDFLAKFLRDALLDPRCLEYADAMADDRPQRRRRVAVAVRSGATDDAGGAIGA